ncbi:MAG: hypothetical protein AB8B86_13410 [Pseudomonadales bacterium]
MSKSKFRNRHACNPIMRKGGVHEKSGGAKRAANKHKTRALLYRSTNQEI